MAFDITNFGLDSASHNSGMPRTWTYTTTDAIATVNTAGYFNNASHLVTVGDRIVAITSSGGTPSYDVFLVNANASGVVDVDDGTAIDGTADSD